MAPPYVIAIVGLEEDLDVRLTTNLVGEGAMEAAVGTRVAVVFEQVEDVWLPLFEPVADAEPAPIPPEQDARIYVRAPISTKRYEHDSVFSGVGHSRVGRRLGVDPLELAVEASLAAVADAGLRLEDIDGLSTYPGAGGRAYGHSEGGITALEEALRLKPTWHAGAAETPGQAGAIVSAMLAVSAGLCRHVLCFRTVWEATFATRPAPVGPADGRVDDQSAWRSPFGAMSAANWIAMCASNYFARYGATREVLGRIAVNARIGAGRNETAIYREPITMDDYFDARMISSPFGLYDCDVPCDGAVAIIVSAAETAVDLRVAPVRIEAVGTQITERISWDQGTISHEPQLMGPSAHLWSRTSLTPADVDVALLYDGFSFNCLSWLEALGFCGMGEASDFIGDGSRIALDGELPLNPHGGQLSAGRTHGFGFMAEAIHQLRGESAARQVPGARLACVSTGGGVPSSAWLLSGPDGA
jgi:acetyl-CoA acetyltransferase